MLYLLALAAFASGIVNALAGGGAFLTFPALLAVGIPAIDANASSTVALCPGQFVSAWAARNALGTASGQSMRDLRSLSVISLIGGSIGALLLLATPSAAFSALVPWLLLFATVVFAAGGQLPAREDHWLGPVTIKLVQFLISIYGGYFGGGIGILMLAALALYGMRDIRSMNALKVLLAALMNTTAAVIFAFSGHVHWIETLTMMAAAMIGGFVGAKAGLVIPQIFVRVTVIVVGALLTIYFFLRPA
jgi:uncharacterized protein